MANNLRNLTRDLLLNRPRKVTLKDIAEATGLSEAWLEIFCRGKVDDPSVNKIEKLYNYLTGKNLVSQIKE